MRLLSALTGVFFGVKPSGSSSRSSPRPPAGEAAAAGGCPEPRPRAVPAGCWPRGLAALSFLGLLPSFKDQVQRRSELQGRSWLARGNGRRLVFWGGRGYFALLVSKPLLTGIPLHKNPHPQSIPVPSQPPKETQMLNLGFFHPLFFSFLPLSLRVDGI